MGARLEGEEIAADPVPVRLPGVDLMGVEDLEAGDGSVGGWQTGRIKMGLKLRWGCMNISCA